MVNRCNSVGVRIYVDALVNHMAAQGEKSSGGSSFSSGSRSYPAVPYGPLDFNDKNCNTSSGDIENFNDLNQVRSCRLVGLPDLATGNENVRNKVAEYFNRLIDMGVAGFRIDAAKHMFPEDLSAIYSRLKDARAEY